MVKLTSQLPRCLRTWLVTDVLAYCDLVLRHTGQQDVSHIQKPRS